MTDSDAPGPFRSAARALLGLAYPELCAACQRSVPGGVLVCDACRPGLPAPETGEAAATFARWPARERPARAVALWRYDVGGAVQRVQRALKYGGRTDAAGTLGRWLGDAVARELGAPRPDAVVPVPLARTRRLERGYNQAEVLAEGVAAGLGLPLLGGLARTRATRSQARLDAAARRANVAGAFTASPTVHGRRVLLVDDVLTTGATLASATAALRDAGAEVDVAVLALAERGAG